MCAAWDNGALRKLSKKLEEVAAMKEVSFKDLFTPEFMTKFSRVGTFEALIEASGIRVNTAEEFLAIPSGVWERVVQQHTQFSSWLEMQQTAGAEYFRQKLAS